MVETKLFDLSGDNEVKRVLSVYEIGEVKIKVIYDTELDAEIPFKEYSNFFDFLMENAFIEDFDKYLVLTIPFSKKTMGKYNPVILGYEFANFLQFTAAVKVIGDSCQNT